MRLSILLLVSAIFWVNGEATADTPEVKVRALVDGVWVHTSWRTVEPWGRVPSNGLIVRDGDQVVVVDTAWGSDPSLVLLDWIDRELGLSVSHLIVTHFHTDRLEGWEVFAARGARVVASARTLELASVVSTDAFDLYQLQRGDRRIGASWEILYPGPAHAEDNVVVWFPAQKVLAGGCAVRAAGSRGLGNVEDASIPEWANSMQRVLQAFPAVEHVVPGHGDVGGVELIRHTIELAEAARVAEVE